MTENNFIEECKKIGIIINEDILNKLKKYMSLLIEWNKKFNLTSILEPENIYIKHFYDSICLTKVGNLNTKKICDFGTGAGFPGIVIAILYKDSKITLIEANNKKCEFLNEVKKNLNLENIEIIKTRVEEYSKLNKEVFDIVTCRAVSNINIILELCCQLVKINGIFAPLKSNIEEINNSTVNLNKLGFSLERIINYKLPIENSTRNIPIYKKVTSSNPKYPRNYNIILKENKTIK